MQKSYGHHRMQKSSELRHLFSVNMGTNPVINSSKVQIQNSNNGNMACALIRD